MKFYKVTCIRGHSGRGNNNNEITFAIVAKNIVEAQYKAKAMPTVKHRKGILFAKEISPSEYNEIVTKNAYKVAYGTNYKRITKS